jgi:hypothetical protein
MEALTMTLYEKDMELVRNGNLFSIDDIRDRRKKDLARLDARGRACNNIYTLNAIARDSQQRKRELNALETVFNKRYDALFEEDGI